MARASSEILRLAERSCRSFPSQDPAVDDTDRADGDYFIAIIGIETSGLGIDHSDAQSVQRQTREVALFSAILEQVKIEVMAVVFVGPALHRPRVEFAHRQDNAQAGALVRPARVWPNRSAMLFDYLEERHRRVSLIDGDIAHAPSAQSFHVQGGSGPA